MDDTTLITQASAKNLPDRFSIDIENWAPAESFATWKLMRAELVQRGYRVEEYFSNDRMVHVADCVREMSRRTPPFDPNH